MAAAGTLARRPSRAGKSRHAGMSLHAVTVREVRRLTPRLVRITLAAPSLRGFRDDGPDQRLKLMLPLAGQRRPVLPDPDDWYGSWQAMPAHVRPVLRTYTVRSARPELGELDVDMVLHGDEGPASAWAARAAVGDEVGIYGAYGEHEVPEGTDWQLLVADHTALPAVAAVLERADPGQRLLALIEVPDAGEQLPLAVPAGAEVRWLHTVPGRPGAALTEAVAGAQLPEGAGYAWVCADARTAGAVRRQLVGERGLAPDAVMFMGYWRTDGPVDGPALRG